MDSAWEKEFKEISILKYQHNTLTNVNEYQKDQTFSAKFLQITFNYKSQC